MPSTCVFEFDRLDPVYYSGEIINGRIILQTTSEKSVRDVYILFEGEAKVRWEERKSRQQDGKTHYYTEYYRANQCYLNTRTTVFAGGTLPPGTHTYTFNILLPLECPTSCVEKYGKISYELSLVLNRPFRFDNVFKQPLTVIQQLNLNLNPEFLIPIINEDIKFFCCWPCSSGPVISTLTIPFGGYAPGQKINFELHIDNQSHGYDLDGFEVRLLQTYTFVAHSPHHKTRTHENKLAFKEIRDQCLRLSKRIVKSSLTIPSVPPTSQQSGIITVAYEIIFSVKTGGCHMDSNLIMPLTIGTIPLAQSAANPSNAEMWIPHTPDTPDTPGDRPPSYDKYKPPSFEEATTIGEHFIDTDVDEHNRTDDFIPKYPMYTNFAVPSAPSMNRYDSPNGAVEPSAPTTLDTPLLSESGAAPPPYPVDGHGNMPQLPSTADTSSVGWRI